MESMFVWAVSSVALVVLILLAIVHTYYRMTQLRDEGVDVSRVMQKSPHLTPRAAIYKATRRQLKRTLYPYVVTFLLGVVWAGLYSLDSSSVYTQAALTAATVSFCVCVVFSMRMYACAYKSERSHTGVKRKSNPY